MATGWYFDSAYQAWFYLGADGAMAVGQREIDGKQYYFNPESDGTKGVLQKEEGKLFMTKMKGLIAGTHSDSCS